MPLGDSITQGFGGSSPLHGYRDQLASLLAQEGVSYDFVGTLADGSGFDPDHEGIPGISAEQLASSIADYLKNTSPDLVLLHIGTNDISNNKPNAATLNNIKSIIEALYRNNNSVKILLAGLVPRKDSAALDQSTRELNELIHVLVLQKWDEGYNIRFVDQYAVFTSNGSWQTQYMKDAIHPNNTGYSQMAATYFAGVQQALTLGSNPDVVDDFNRSGPGLGSNWAAHSAYKIVSEQLANTSTEDAWGQMATWTVGTNPRAVSFAWGSGADASGINEGGLALRLSAPSATANGYLVWLTTTEKNINLWTIENGAPSSSIETVPYTQPEPVAGDIFKVVLRSDANGHHFDCYVNDVLYGRVRDADKTQGNVSETYAGFMLKGNLNNDIDDFGFAIGTGGDDIPPSTTSDLAVQAVGPRSVTLQWTAPGDDDVFGAAAQYLVRYSKTPINPDNFDSADEAANSLVPSEAGAAETMTVSGLEPETLYYFALKTKDEAENLSDISNLVSATTGADFSSGDDFERSDLGPDWTTHPAYKIVNGELRNTSTQDSWNFLAVYTGKKNALEVSFTWGLTADDAGIDEGGFALMLNAAATDASGYLLWRRAGTIELWTIVNGAPEASVNSASGGQASLAAGDQMKVVVRTNASGHHFDLFINNQLDGTVSDPGKLQGSAPILYSGVMLHGKRKNPIDNFTVTPKTGSGAQLIYISGDGQVGAPGEQLAKPLVVGVTDENGIPTQGFPVTFVVTVGDGTVSEPQPVLTDANGRAKAFLTLGATQALHKVEARGNNLAGSPFVFTATTKAGNPVNLLKVAGDGQTGIAGQILPAPVQVQVTDELGTGVPNRPVTFTVTSGGGSANGQTSATVSTNMQGMAQISWKIGSQTNATNVLQASSSFSGSPLLGSPLSFSASAILGFTSVDSFSRADLGPTWTAHPAFKIINGELRNTSTQNSWNFVAVYNAKRSPKEVGFKWGTTANETGIDEGGFALMLNAASTTANGYLLWRRPSSGTIELWTIVNGAPNAPVASAQGAQPNPAAGDEMKVTMRSSANGHHFDLFINKQFDGTVTDPEKLQGNAAVLYSGVMMHGNRKNPIDRYTITATAGAAVEIALVSGNDQKGAAGQPLANPLVVKVTDANGIPVPATAVTFVVTAGGGKLSGTQPVLTNSAGEAKTVLTLSTTQALNKVEARAQGLTGSPVLFSATAQAGNPKNLAKVAGDAQSGSGGLTLPNPIQVKVTDNLGTVVPNHPVTFTVTGGAGSVNQEQPNATVNTNAQGIAQVSWKLGTPGAAQTLQVSSSFNGNALTGSPLTFTATTSPPSKVTLNSGNGQVGSINTPLPKPFEVIVKDGGGKPIGGYKVTFTVMEGNGNLNGKSTIDAFTNSEGKAAATLTMGPTPRASNKVRATAIYNGNNLPDSPITFAASAVGLKNISIFFGNGQSGVVGESLPQPLKAKVLDSLGVGIRNQNIIFKVIAGGGKLTGTDTVKTVKTDTLGIASIPLTLGTKPVSNKVRAEINPALSGSPLLFEASSQPGLPDKLLKASKDSTSGVVNNTLPTPLMTKVTDKFGNPLAGVNVIFTVKAGGGKVNGALKDTVKTQANGQAAATLVLGSASGNLNNSVEVRAYNGAKELNNSPVMFVATATTSRASVMKIQGGGRQDGGRAGEPAPNLLSLKVIDAFNNGVANHPVKFEIKRGGGHFGNLAKKDSSVITDATGVAKIRWYLGKTIKPDSQIVHATSNDGVNPLRTSPLKFVAFAKAGPPSVEGSFVQAGAASILANGVANSQITVNVRDKVGNPVANAPVIIMVSGDGNNVQQPTKPTDAQGKATGSFTTTRSGTKTVTAKIIGGIDITRSAEVQARPLEASGVNPAGGNSQTGNTNAALPLPMMIKVNDKNGNGVPDYEVSLKVEQGGGKLFDTVSSQLVDSLRVQTKADGFAEVYYICGSTPMENRVRVIAPALSNSPFLFLAQAITPQPAKLVMLSGNKQEGTAGEVLAKPLVVRVTDANMRPISNVPVNLSVTLGGGLIEGQRQLRLNSNVFGDVIVNWRLGAEAGLNFLRAESPSLSGSPVDFEAQSKPGNASALSVVRGNPAYGNVNSQSEPLVVQTVDAQNNGVAGIPVIFELVEGGGTLTDNYVVTGNGGGASVKVNFNGTSGWRKVRVSSEGLAGSPVIMTAFARPLAATRMDIVKRTNNQKGTKGKLLNFPLQVKVLDGLGNSVPGVQVNFVVTTGGGNFNNSGSAFVTSDTNGIASAPWTLGAATASNQARAIKNGLNGSPFTFNATGFDNNFPIIDDLPDRQIIEGDQITFNLSGTDADNDPIRFGAKNLPPGAVFDSLRTLRFDWRSDVSNSAGRYEVSFLAYDTRGGVDEELVVIDVQNRNRAPSIFGRFPVRSDTVLAQLGVPLRMRVLARDPDGDVLSYRWYVNGVFTGAITSTFNYLGDLKWNLVEAVVFDLEYTVRTSWHIRVPVELESFMATVSDGPGVQLSWKTGSETNNAGFNVLRSGRPNEHYAKLNEQLIPASRDGKYSYADLSAEAGVRYYYKLEALDLQGNVTLHGPVMVEAALPKVFDLMQNYPNPFSARGAFGNQITHIRYSLPAAVAVSLTIYNSLGQEVRKLANGPAERGYHTAIWDGRDQAGRPAPSGIYYYRLIAGSFTANRKMLLAK